MVSKSELTEIRREQILEAATSVFARFGVYKARMDDIVEEAGLSKGAVYWYFKSKDEILKNHFGVIYQPRTSWVTRTRRERGLSRRAAYADGRVYHYRIRTICGSHAHCL